MMTVMYHMDEKSQIKTKLDRVAEGELFFNILEIDDISIFATKEQLKQIADSINKALKS